MATATVDIGTLITRSPTIRGGRPRIVGTGVTVQRIVGWYKLGVSPEEIAARSDVDQERQGVSGENAVPRYPKRSG